MSTPGTAATGADQAVTVQPTDFTLVAYDAETIRALARELIGYIGLPASLRLGIEVDETTFLGWSRLTDIDPATPAARLMVESGAFEDPRRPRQFSRTAAVDVMGRHLLRLKDRLDPNFGPAGSDDDLSLQLKTAWDAYAVGRMARLGYPTQRQRRLYQFRVRHGFNDTVDAVFAQLWNGDNLTWADIARQSERAASSPR